MNGAVQEGLFGLKDLSANAEFMHILRNADIRTMHSCEATLEDIFIKLTGRNLL